MDDPAQGKAERGKARTQEELRLGRGNARIIGTGQAVTDMDSKTLERLQRWEQENGQLSGAIKLYCELLRMQGEVNSSINIAKPFFTEGLAQERLRDGVPLLSFDDFSPDWNHVQATFHRVLQWLYADSQGNPGELESLRRVVQDSSLVRTVVRAWYGGYDTDLSHALGIDACLLTSVVGAALKPFLAACSRLLLPEVDQELWRRPYCPVCGGKPDFACLDRESGARWLLCSQCDAEWLFSRLQCPYCGTEDQDSVSYFTDDEGSQLYRLYVCERCGTYLKTLDLRRAGTEVSLPLERVKTLHMDIQGQEKGYRPGWSRSDSSGSAAR